MTWVPKTSTSATKTEAKQDLGLGFPIFIMLENNRRYILFTGLLVFLHFQSVLDANWYSILKGMENSFLIFLAYLPPATLILLDLQEKKISKCILHLKVGKTRKGNSGFLLSSISNQFLNTECNS